MICLVTPPKPDPRPPRSIRIEPELWDPASDRALNEGVRGGLSTAIRDFVEYYGAGGKWPLG